MKDPLRHLMLCCAALLLLGSLHAGPLSREEALAVAFPGASVRSERIFLTEAQREQAARLSGVKIPTALIARYIALREGEEIGRAYVDTHAEGDTP